MAVVVLAVAVEAFANSVGGRAKRRYYLINRS